MGRFCIMCLFLSIMLSGCAIGSAKKLAFNRYVIQTPYGGDVAYDVAVDKLSREAAGICKKGYRKVNDFDTRKGSQRLLVWEVSCRGADRSKETGRATGPEGRKF